MQHQAVTLLRAVTVQPVTEDRCVQTLRVRRMNSQLMRAAGTGVEIHEDRTISTPLAYLITRDRRLAMIQRYHLARTIIGVRQ